MERKKDILILMASFAGGGAEKVMIDLLRHFDRSKYNITVAVLWCYGPHLKSVPEDIELLPIFKRAPNFIDHKTRSWRFIHNPIWKHKLLKALGNRKFDVTISFMEGQTALLHSYIMDRARVNVSWVHIDIQKNWWYGFLMNRDQERAIYAKMDAIACVSEGVKNAFSTAVGTLPNLTVVYNLIDRNEIIRRSNEFDVEKDCFTIINMARLQPEKCQYRILQMASSLKKKGLKFKVRILGTGKLESELKQMAATLDVADCVEFLGFKNNPYPYIKAGDMFLLTSDAEGYPLAVCEALCLNKPVVSTKITGPDELLANGTGILTGKDPQEIADNVEKLMTDRNLLAHYAEAAERKGLSFSPDDTMRKIESLWEDKL